MMAKYKIINSKLMIGKKKAATIAGISNKINKIIAGPIVFLRGFLGLRGNCSLVLLVAGVMNDTLF